VAYGTSTAERLCAALEAIDPIELPEPALKMYASFLEGLFELFPESDLRLCRHLFASEP
jgi:hypothetical protein